MTPPDEPGVWVFNGNNSTFPSAVFTTVEKANEWIAKHKLSGVLTWYPLDSGTYDWMIEKGHWQPKKDYQKTAEFIQRFHSGLAHEHYENGWPYGQPPENDTQATT
jgi:hypothetical protein